MKYQTTSAITRRKLIKLTAIGTSGLALGVHLSTTADPSDVLPGKDSRPGAKANHPLNAFIAINEDDTVIIRIKHLEFGQGVFTGLACIAAEEMDADWDKVVSEHAPADVERYNNLLWGPTQETGGSTSIANSYEQMREMGATARAMLIAAAARAWGVSPAKITAKNGVVFTEDGTKRASFGDLARAASQEPIPDKLQLKSPSDYQLVGAEKLKRKDTGKYDGTAIYTQDINLPGQLTSVVLHPPRFGAAVGSVELADALATPGVVDVFEVPNGVAVVAEDFWSAQKGREAISVTWDNSSAYRGSSREIMQRYRELAEQPGTLVASRGDIGNEASSANESYTFEFEFPYLAHAPMEPMNCVIHLRDESCEVFNGCQAQSRDQAKVAEALGFQPEQVFINTLYAGGSFGRRSNPAADYVLEAVAIAKKLRERGRAVPVKLVWTREDDMRSGFYRPMYFHRIKASLDETGLPESWQHRIVGQPILSSHSMEYMFQQEGIDFTSTEGASNLPYHVPNFSVDLHSPRDEAVPVLWWRSVGSTHTAYATEVVIDELAVRAGIDPVDYRMHLLADHPRHKQVLQLATEKANWGVRPDAGIGRGVAVHESFNTFVALVADVKRESNGELRVLKITCAVDCGLPINPDIIRAQMEGGILFGLSPLMMSEITLEDGVVQQSNFHDYPVLRLNQAPEIEVHIVDSTEPPTGVGEPGTPVAAPAVANALSSLTGKRYASLPIRDENWFG